jgi:TIR domain
MLQRRPLLYSFIPGRHGASREQSRDHRGSVPVWLRTPLAFAASHDLGMGSPMPAIPPVDSGLLDRYDMLSPAAVYFVAIHGSFFEGCDMKVFISWSGLGSREVAVALRHWLPSVIQAVEPYVSSEDIEAGARWGEDVADQLEDTDFGILCVTRNNVASAWLNFEAGALSKAVDRSRVVPFLIDLAPSDIPKGPLAQFQAVRPTKAGILKLVRGMNNWSKAISDDKLEEAVDVWWPHLESKLQRTQEQVMREGKSTVPQRTSDDMLAELLELSRGIQRELQVVRSARLSTYSRSEYDQDVIRAIASLSAKRGFRVTHLETPDAPVDLRIERGDRTVYVEITQSRSLLEKARRTLQRLERFGASNPLLLVSYNTVRPELESYLDKPIRVVQWQGPQDDEALGAAIEELSRGQA